MIDYRIGDRVRTNRGVEGVISRVSTDRVTIVADDTSVTTLKANIEPGAYLLRARDIVAAEMRLDGLDVTALLAGEVDDCLTMRAVIRAMIEF